MFYLPAIQALIVSLAVWLLVPSATGSRSSSRQWDDVEELRSSVELNSSPKRADSKPPPPIDASTLMDAVQPESAEVDVPESGRHKAHTLSFCDILKLQNVVAYCLCFACLKSVNYAVCDSL